MIHAFRFNLALLQFILLKGMKAMIYLVLFPREKTVFKSDELTDIVNSTPL